MAPENDQSLTPAEAYEAAYRFVWQYAEREPESESLQLMLVAMEPIADRQRTSDPASWEDWLQCVKQTTLGEPVPSFDRTEPGDSAV